MIGNHWLSFLSIEPVLKDKIALMKSITLPDLTKKSLFSFFTHTRHTKVLQLNLPSFLQFSTRSTSHSSYSYFSSVSASSSCSTLHTNQWCLVGVGQNQRKFNPKSPHLPSLLMIKCSPSVCVRSCFHTWTQNKRIVIEIVVPFFISFYRKGKRERKRLWHSACVCVCEEEMWTIYCESNERRRRDDDNKEPKHRARKKMMIMDM